MFFWALLACSDAVVPDAETMETNELDIGSIRSGKSFAVFHLWSINKCARKE
jgi:hypothetical protein